MHVKLTYKRKQHKEPIGLTISMLTRAMLLGYRAGLSNTYSFITPGGPDIGDPWARACPGCPGFKYVEEMMPHTEDIELQKKDCGGDAIFTKVFGCLLLPVHKI